MDIQELEWLAANAANRRAIVEIGSWKGRSTKAMGGATLGVVYAVDHYRGADAQNNAINYKEAMELGPERFSEIFKRNLSDEIAAGHVVQVVSDSIGAVERVQALLKGGRPDMVFIDGDHDYEAVKRDISTWRPLIASGGILSGHDYRTGANPGVVRAVDELVPGFKRVAESIWYIEIPK
jgi:predicted O-methyltransferase YrrM